MDVTLFSIAQRFIGTKEAPGSAVSNPLVLAMLQLDAAWVEDDQTSWCSAFLNFGAWLINVPRSKSLAARSWLLVGHSIALSDARPGWDVVVLTRGPGKQPGPDVIAAPGHVGLYAGRDDANGTVLLLGGNQGDAVSIAAFPKARILGVRRLVV